LSLPGLFKTDEKTIPATVPYLSIPEKYKSVVPKLRQSPALKVGLVWAGKPTHRNDLNRSCRLQDLAPLLSVPGTIFISLQMGAAARRIEDGVVSGLIADVAPRLRDFRDCAAIIDRRDRVISMDSAPGHLAGALARPVWMLAPAVGDWRWGIKGS